MRHPLVAANWKMHGRLHDIEPFASRLATDIADVDVVICPPSVYVAELVARLPAPLQCGVQDIGIAASGPHTGELAAEMVRDIGAGWTIVGHSERRLDFEEADDFVATKVAAAVRGGLNPIVCVGETLTQREAGQEMAVVARQLEHVLDRVDLADLISGGIGYEPVWAIGTGQTASPEQAQQMHEFIRSLLTGYDEVHAQAIRIVYGGSVKPDNAAELFAQADIDGGLVGGASLDVEQFNQIVAAAVHSVA